MEKIKIYKWEDGLDGYILWRGQLIRTTAENISIGFCKTHGNSELYTLYGSLDVMYFQLQAEAQAAYDELTALLEQAKKQLAEADAKKSEIEAARELLKDGKRVRLYTEDYVVGKTRFFIFQSRGIGVSDDCDCKVGEINTRDGVFRFTVAGRVHVFRTRKKAEKMRNKFIDMLARAKAQLLLEEYEN